MQPIAIPPHFLIFLDIDGVLNTKFLHPELDIKIEEATGEANHTASCLDTCEKCKAAAALLFEKTAVDSLHDLIERMQIFAKVSIVLSSNWRCGHSLKEIKAIMASHKFSKLIIDKTTEDEIHPSDDSWWDNCSISHFVSSEGISKIQKGCRAHEINAWLKNNPEHFGYIVLDDRDNGSHLSGNFGSKFIHTIRENQPPLFTKEKAEEAYFEFLHQIFKF